MSYPEETTSIISTHNQSLVKTESISMEVLVIDEISHTYASQEIVKTYVCLYL